MIHPSYYDVLALPGNDEAIMVVVGSLPVKKPQLNPRAAAFFPGEESEVPVPEQGVPWDRTTRDDDESIFRAHTATAKTKRRQMKNHRAKELQKCQKGVPVRLRKGV